MTWRFDTFSLRLLLDSHFPATHLPLSCLSMILPSPLQRQLDCITSTCTHTVRRSDLAIATSSSGGAVEEARARMAGWADKFPVCGKFPRNPTANPGSAPCVDVGGWLVGGYYEYCSFPLLRPLLFLLSHSYAFFRPNHGADGNTRKEGGEGFLVNQAPARGAPILWRAIRRHSRYLVRGAHNPPQPPCVADEHNDNNKKTTPAPL